MLSDAEGREHDDDEDTLEEIRDTVNEIRDAGSGIVDAAPYAWTYLLFGVGYGVASGLSRGWLSGVLGGFFWPFAVGWSIASGTICRP